MKKFWSYISNDKYSVGCTGQTVYVYDKAGNELAKFKDIIYAYTPKFSPNNKIFVVKSTDGRIAIYDLESLKLIKKFRYSKVDCAQDDGFCFSKDGKQFYNVEKHGSSLNSCISVYDTTDFSLIDCYYKDYSCFMPDYIEYDEEFDTMFVLGFIRGEEGYAHEYFVSKFSDGKLSEICYINDKDYEYYSDFKHLELSGFTQKSKEWSGFAYNGIDTKNIEREHRPLSGLWKKYMERG